MESEAKPLTKENPGGMLPYRRSSAPPGHSGQPGDRRDPGPRTHKLLPCSTAPCSLALEALHEPGAVGGPLRPAPALLPIVQSRLPRSWGTELRADFEETAPESHRHQPVGHLLPFQTRATPLSLGHLPGSCTELLSCLHQVLVLGSHLWSDTSRGLLGSTAVPFAPQSSSSHQEF